MEPFNFKNNKQRSGTVVKIKNRITNTMIVVMYKKFHLLPTW